MGAPNAFEEAASRLHPQWATLAPVKDFHEAMKMFLLEELPKGTTYSPEGLTAANHLCNEFRNDIWTHRIPDVGELVHADGAGHLQEEIDAINLAYANGL